MSQTRVPFSDLIAQHRNLRAELSDVFQSVLGTATFIGGPMVEDFERAFAEYCDTRYCIGVGSGTDALRFALMASGVTTGDLVVTTPHTFIATTEAISQAGASPVFVDIDESTYNIDTGKLEHYCEAHCHFEEASQILRENKSGRPVRAIVPVHLYGQMADMDSIGELAARFHLVVIEDACQAHGAQYFSGHEGRWRTAGSIGKAGAFSFYPGKNLGACGEAGAITTDDEDLARSARMLRDHGQARKYYHDAEGYNGRLDALQAGILLTKLKYLPDWTAQRRTAARRYRELFDEAGTELVLPFDPEWSKSSYHLFVVRVRNRDRMIQSLASAGIGTGIHYPVPLHLQKAYAALGYLQGDFPSAEAAAREILSLPMFPTLTLEQQREVVNEVTTQIEEEALNFAT
jgi:dTDP-4-amino-4,6-dideoxygalactose transaminase